MKQLTALMLIVALAAPAGYAADAAGRRDKTAKGAAIGAAAGAIFGAVVGNNRGKGDAKRGAIVGGVVGGVAGTVIGVMMDKQERELRQIEGIDVTRTGDDELRVTVRNDVLFDFNSSSLRSASRESLREMADVFDKYANTTIAVEGHTDSVGSTSYNQSLSIRRASTVSNYLEGLGVSASRLDTYGRGETEPRASNNTASGRQQNRRVEIFVRANG